MLRPALLLPVVVLAACGPPSRTDQILALSGDATAGEAVYTDNCAVCHLADGTGRANGGVGVNFTVVLGNIDEEKAVDTILEGKEEMTPFADVLDDQEIADVVAYVFETFAP